MAKKPLRIYKSSGSGTPASRPAPRLVVPPAPAVRSAIPVYRDSTNQDQLTITQQVYEHPEVHRARSREAANSRYEELLHSIYDAVAITDLNGVIREVNARAEHVFGRERDSMIQKNITQLIAGADEELLKVVRQNVNNRRFTILEAVCLREDGSRFFAEIVVNRLRSEEQRNLCFMFRDISERKKAESELINVNDQLLEAEKIQVRLDTISTLWYELNNPLQILTCMAELDRNPEYKRQLARIVGVLEQLREQSSLDPIVDDNGESRYPLATEPELNACAADHLMVVDDEAVLRDIFATSLRTEFPYLTVDAAGNGEEALDRFRSGRHGLIVLDVSMPVMSGEEAYAQIARYCEANRLKIPRVIFCTGFVLSDSLKATIGDGSVHVCLQKPLTMTELVEAVRSRLAGPSEGEAR